ncbi:MAG: VUT family protein [Leptolyngbya sp. PLA3]|nr:MAG: VUT family protein [Cyanobacteria bacterium CYA]MCE7968593.1 VUT family protein [Leptolyngbya sp. PL-A3]
MIAFLFPQFVDVQFFHVWNKLTSGPHLWLRNNGSTLISPMVDTVAMNLTTYFDAHALPVDENRPIWPQLWLFMGTGYAFTLSAVRLDTAPFYLGSHDLTRHLRFRPSHGPVEHATGAAVEAGVGVVREGTRTTALGTIRDTGDTVAAHGPDWSPGLPTPRRVQAPSE